MTERNLSPVYVVLRASARRVLRLIESEIARQGGSATILSTCLKFVARAASGDRR